MAVEAPGRCCDLRMQQITTSNSQFAAVESARRRQACRRFQEKTFMPPCEWRARFSSMLVTAIPFDWQPLCQGSLSCALLAHVMPS
mmetsp:Transcript_82644/g.192022  ORF Transcript_82644/g.192022 Transcript_82644/m.192022 type:complete len:86 (-) Transcript_82644:894-1151(-)